MSAECEGLESAALAESRVAYIAEHPNGVIENMRRLELTPKGLRAIGWPQLPGPVATHWGVDGQPDGATSKSWLWCSHWHW